MRTDLVDAIISSNNRTSGPRDTIGSLNAMGKIVEVETRESLPKNVVPQHYSIHITVTEDFEHFNGTEDVCYSYFVILII
jgi:hypothetical protein